MRLSRRWSRMHEFFSWPKANTSFSYWKKKFDLNTKTWTKAKPVTESRKTNDDTDHLSTLSGIGLMIPPCWNHSQKVWIYILYALGYVTANRFDCERSSLSPESSNKLMIFANGLTLVTNGLTENVFRLSHFGITKNRKKDTHRSLWLLVFKKKELFIPFVPFHLRISRKTAFYLTPIFCIPFVFPFFGYYTHPKRNWRQCFCKILGGKQGVLWEMCKWRILENNASKSGERTRDSQIIWRISKDHKPGGWGESLQGIKLV